MPDLAQEAAKQARNLLSTAAQRLLPKKAEKLRRDQHRWLVVTIAQPPEELTPHGELAAALAELGDQIEVQIRPAPRDQGTELAARLTTAPGSPQAEDGLRGTLRQILRQIKQVAEAGEVLIAEPRPEGHRPTTIAGALVDKAEQKSDRGGVL